jgi:hypothetical protein
MSRSSNPAATPTSCEGCALRDFVASGEANQRTDAHIDASPPLFFMSGFRGGLSAVIAMRMHYRNQMRWRESTQHSVTEFINAVPSCPGLSTEPTVEVPNPAYTSDIQRTRLGSWVARHLVDHLSVPETLTVPSDAERCRNEQATPLLHATIV